MGRLCVEHYRILHRQCVFSHEELVCKMAADPDGLDLVVAAKTYQDLLVIAEKEKVLRKKLLDRVSIQIELRMEKGNMLKRQPPNERLENSKGPPMGLQRNK